MISPVVAPGVKTLATPISVSSGMSASGTMPPPKTTMSRRVPLAQQVDDLRANSVMCAPDSTDMPIASASSWMAVSTICSGVWCSPV